jgi:hypothetical protein
MDVPLGALFSQPRLHIKHHSRPVLLLGQLILATPASHISTDQPIFLAPAGQRRNCNVRVFPIFRFSFLHNMCEFRRRNGGNGKVITTCLGDCGNNGVAFCKYSKFPWRRNGVLTAPPTTEPWHLQAYNRVLEGIAAEMSLLGDWKAAKRDQ